MGAVFALVEGLGGVMVFSRVSSSCWAVLVLVDGLVEAISWLISVFAGSRCSASLVEGTVYTATGRCCDGSVWGAVVVGSAVALTVSVTRTTHEWLKTLHFSHRGGFHSYSTVTVIGVVERGLFMSKLWTKSNTASTSTHNLAYSNRVQPYVSSSHESGRPTIFAAKLSPCLDHKGNGKPCKRIHTWSVEILFLSNWNLGCHCYRMIFFPPNIHGPFSKTVCISSSVVK